MRERRIPSAQTARRVLEKFSAKLRTERLRPQQKTCEELANNPKVRYPRRKARALWQPLHTGLGCTGTAQAMNYGIRVRKARGK